MKQNSICLERIEKSRRVEKVYYTEKIVKGGGLMSCAGNRGKRRDRGIESV